MARHDERTELRETPDYAAQVFHQLHCVFATLTGTVLFFGFTAILISVFSSLTIEEVQESETTSNAEYAVIIQKLDELSLKTDELSQALRDIDRP